MSNKTVAISKLSIRLLLGVFFIGTAVLKLLSIDSFDIYIYSLGIFNYVTTTFISRLLIFIELFIGISLILKIQYQKIWWFTAFTVAAFTDFLIYVAIFRDDSNCHCFGDIIELGPWQSIFKNIIIIALLFFIKNEDGFDLFSRMKPRFKKWIYGVFIAFSVIISFVVLPMDVIYNMIYSEQKSVNTKVFYESLNDSTYNDCINFFPEKPNEGVVFEHETKIMDVREGRYLINYALAGCKFCKVGAEKLTLMVDRHGISHDKVKFIIGGSDEAIGKFIENTNTSDYEHWKIPAPEFMSITYGKFPLYVFIEDGKIVKAGDYRILDDESIKFLK